MYNKELTKDNYLENIYSFNNDIFKCSEKRFSNNISVNENSIPFTYNDSDHIISNEYESYVKTIGVGSNAISINSFSKTETEGVCTNAIATSWNSVAKTKNIRSNAISLDKDSQAHVEGEGSIACSLGSNSWVSGKKNTWIILVDWRNSDSNDRYIHDIYKAQVGIDKIQNITIEEDKKYSFKDGILIVKELI